jgi:hypothetical protein
VTTLRTAWARRKNRADFVCLMEHSNVGRAASENWSLRLRMRMLSLVNTTKTTTIDLTTWCGYSLMGKILSNLNFPGDALCLVVSIVLACVLMARAIPASETPFMPLEPPAAEPQEPITPIPISLALDPQRVALGERLFDDVRLSHDNTWACTMCHPLQHGGMDGQSHASIANGTAFLRNTPDDLQRGPQCRF